MKTKEFILDGQLKFSVTKRKASRNIKISLGNDGRVKVSIPTYVPYAAAISFVKSRRTWINKHLPEVKIYRHGMQLGKSHHLQIIKEPGAKSVETRIVGGEARLILPPELSSLSFESQAAARGLAVRVYRSQAKQLLPLRVKELATKYDFKYANLRFRDLKSRWGSCDHSGNITLSIKLMELPWDLIDYVILHELNHTKYLNHSPKFWDNLKMLMPDALEKRKQIKLYRAGV